MKKCLFAFMVVVHLEAYAQQGLIYPFESTNAYSTKWILEDSYPRHEGVDYACIEGTPIYAPISGYLTVAYDEEDVKSCEGFGNTWKIENPNYKVRGAHLLYKSIPFEVGEYVYAGQFMGFTSNSGYSTNTSGDCLPDVGYHFHLETEDKDGNILNPYDGHFIIDDDGSFRFPREVFYGTEKDITIDYPQFTVEDMSNFNLVGNTVHDPNVKAIALNLGGRYETSAIWFKDRLYIAGGFEIYFTFWISGDGADGLALVIQNDNDMAIGGAGGGLGLKGIFYVLGIEIDLWRNSAADFGAADPDDNDNHISILVSYGDDPIDVSQEAVYPDVASGQATNIPWLSDGELHAMKVRYFDGILSVYVDDMDLPYLSVPIDIANLLDFQDGKAWIGFTGATGSWAQQQYIFSWNFTTEDNSPKPELITVIEIDNPVPRVDDLVAVRGTVYNGGEVASDPCQAVISFGDQSVMVNVPAISANGHDFVEHQFLLNTEGEQIVSILIDSEDVVVEINEDNNLTETLVTVLPALRPDLVINSMAIFKKKGEIKVEVKVENIGTADAENFNLDLTIPETGDYQSKNIVSLPASSSEIIEFTFKKLSAKGPVRGEINFISTIDPDDWIDELDETNNQSQTSVTLRK